MQLKWILSTVTWQTYYKYWYLLFGQSSRFNSSQNWFDSHVGYLSLLRVFFCLFVFLHMKCVVQFLQSSLQKSFQFHHISKRTRNLNSNGVEYQLLVSRYPEGSDAFSDMVIKLLDCIYLLNALCYNAKLYCHLM